MMEFDRNRFEEAMRLWTEWNGKINVISRKDTDNIYEHHILHSLAIAEYLSRFCGLPPQQNASLRSVPPVSDGPLPLMTPGVAQFCCDGRPQKAGVTQMRILDVGTGGGFPGIPLAMVFPEFSFTLCDSIGKKVKVAAAVADGLGLSNVKCVNARAETLPDIYDIVVSRAVTSLDNFYPWVKGRFTDRILYLKGGDVNPEIAALCAKYRLDPHKITAWPISEWLDDDYFAEKFVIDIRK